MLGLPMLVNWKASIRAMFFTSGTSATSSAMSYFPRLVIVAHHAVGALALDRAPGPYDHDFRQLGRGQGRGEKEGRKDGDEFPEVHGRD